MFCGSIIPIILIIMLVLLAVILTGLFEKSPQKTGGSQKMGGSHKRLYVNKFYKKSTLPEVDYDLPSLYEKMKINDPWSLWPQVFVDDWAF